MFHDFNGTQITQIIMIRKDLGYRLSELDAVFHDFNRTQITLIIMIRNDYGKIASSFLIAMTHRF